MSHLTTGNHTIKFERDSFSIQLSTMGTAAVKTIDGTASAETLD